MEAEDKEEDVVCSKLHLNPMLRWKRTLLNLPLNLIWNFRVTQILTLEYRKSG